MDLIEGEWQGDNMPAIVSQTMQRNGITASDGMKQQTCQTKLQTVKLALLVKLHEMWKSETPEIWVKWESEKQCINSWKTTF